MIFQQEEKSIPIQHVFHHSNRKAMVRRDFSLLKSMECFCSDILTDEPVRVKEPVLTSEPPSEILYIRGLTRPFSLMQLKGLLSRYGKLLEEGFWLDKIKSQCFVTVIIRLFSIPYFEISFI